MTRIQRNAEIRQRSDEALVAAIRADDSSAWEELVRRYEKLVMSVARGIGLSSEDAEDVFQATWRTLYEHLHSIRNPGRIAFWIRTTALREAWRLGRERSLNTLPNSEIESLPSAGSVGLDPSLELSKREQHSEVIAALEQLEPRCRVLLTRLFLDQPPPAYADLGAELGIPIGSIGPTRVRCLEKLARILGAVDTD